MITDFVDDSTPIVLGRKRYFDSTLAPGEAASTLRVVGERRQRNFYILRDGKVGPLPPTARVLMTGLVC